MEPTGLLPTPFTKRLTARHWVALDVVLAVVLGVSSVLGHHPGLPLTASGAIRLAAIVAACAPLPARRRYPLPVLAVTVVADAVLTGLGTNVPSHLAVGFAMYSVVTSSRRRLPVGILVAALVPVLAASMVHATDRNVKSFVFAPAVILVGWLAGENTRARRSYAADLAAQAVERERERARQEAAGERVRIARELHDVVAHAMSVVAVRSGVARAVQSTRPEEAQEALGIIETVSRRGLGELRRIVSVLRDSDQRGRAELAHGELAPAPGLTDLPALVDDLRRAGLRVELHVDGEPRSLPPAEDLSVFRIAQEALTNVVRHTTDATAAVTLRYRRDGVEIECIDDGGIGFAGPPPANGDGAGHGIVGMKERVALYGGRLEAGRLAEGFRVWARLPVAEEAP